MKDELIVPNWLGYKRMQNGGCKVKNYLDGGTVTVLNPEEYHFLKRIKNNTVEMEEINRDEWLENTLEKFAELDMIRLRRVLYKDGACTQRTVHAFRKTKMTGTSRAVMWLGNVLVMFLAPCSLLYVLYGLPAYRLSISVISDCLSVPSLLISCALGIVLHELGHVMAAFGYGARVFEFGISMRFGLFLGGAYVMSDSDYSCSRAERVQVDMAGVEMNLILSAVFMILGMRIPGLERIGVCGSIFNLACAIWNTFLSDSDGMAAMKEVFRDRHLDVSIRRARFFFLIGNKKRKKTFRSVPHLAACYAFGLIRFFPVAYAGWVLEIIMSIQLRGQAVLEIFGHMRVACECVLRAIAFGAVTYLFGIFLWLLVNTFLGTKKNRIWEGQAARN